MEPVATPTRANESPRSQQASSPGLSTGPEPTREEWIASRHAAVTAPAGNLALVEYVPVEPGETPQDLCCEAIPGLAGAREPGREGVLLHVPEGMTAAVDGVPFSGVTHVDRLGPDGHPLVTIDRFTLDVFSLDGSDHELRIYDPKSERREAFEEIEYYPEDLACVVRGQFRPYEETEQVAWGFTRDTDTGHRKKVPGVVAVEIAGQAYELLAFLDGETMVLVYADGTTGVESYAPGKFLRVPAPDPGGAVELDFNRSFIPPCGFSYAYSCPVPPAQNTISAPLRAGEIRVRFTEER